jgi:hypothetical protein
MFTCYVNPCEKVSCCIWYGMTECRVNTMSLQRSGVLVQMSNWEKSDVMCDPNDLWPRISSTHTAVSEAVTIFFQTDFILQVRPLILTCFGRTDFSCRNLRLKQSRHLAGCVMLVHLSCLISHLLGTARFLLASSNCITWCVTKHWEALGGSQHHNKFSYSAVSVSVHYSWHLAAHRCCRLGKEFWFSRPWFFFLKWTTLFGILFVIAWFKGFLVAKIFQGMTIRWSIVYLLLWGPR